ncbi:hypothetical protein AUK22_03775 [bacterium CG2_30_54_10]|nr:MAG: hypothetical protein AUK22_03775 [bacterium CG2_30_54_10]
MTNRKKGFALLGSVLFAALLVTLFLKYFGEAGLQARIDSNLDQALQGRLAARAGLSMGLALLFQDRNPTDDYDESWSEIPRLTSKYPIEVGNGTCSVTISDEAAKLNVNLSDEETLTTLFEKFDLGLLGSATIFGEPIRQGASRRLAQHILDYLDLDDSPRPMGAETDAYRAQNLPPPRNSPMLDIRELRNIPGLTPELFFRQGRRPGLSDLLTVEGEGFINLNTARREVVESIPGPPGYFGEKRKAYFDALYKCLPFKRVAGYYDFLVSYDPWIQKQYSNRFVLFSSFFRVESEGWVGKVVRRMTAFVVRSRVGEYQVKRLEEVP